LAHTAKAAGAKAGILDAVNERNQAMRDDFAQRIIARLGGNLKGKKVVVWGLAFKPKTDDIREAPAISVVEALLKAGATVAVHDPRAMEAAQPVLGNRVTYHEDSYEPLAGADALVACTEWMEYRSPDFDRIRELLKQPLIFDGRNIYDLDVMARYDFEYHSIGRPSLNPA
ncbi:MAG: UDP-glucose/GDP-mannose dehydrogenase family protein, partial [Phycisphaerales bacterium]|nr:UDP-glucose/GDP-mannose dehydrogenase family protein [Phycisphaerales bacterium]